MSSTFPNVDTVKSILQKVDYNGDRLQKNQITKLLGLKLSGEPMLNLKDRNFILDSVGLINQIGFEEAYSYLKSRDKEKNRHLIIKKSAPFKPAARRFFLETTKDLRVEKVKSYMKCKRCGENEVDTETRQVRSGDEGATSFHTCRNCGLKWTEN